MEPNKKTSSWRFTVIFIGIILLLIAGLFSYCSVIHRYDYYHGKVVDLETREPIEGAVVLAVYYTQQYAIGGSKHVYLDAHEALTNKKGEFRIPSFTYLTFRPFHKFYSWPSFTIFKSEYGCFPNHPQSRCTGPCELWIKPKKYVVIQLPKLNLLAERIKNLDYLPVTVPRNKMKNLLYQADAERIDLGIEPYFHEKLG